jgi:predicted XRE-type DNA-binding protein
MTMEKKRDYSAEGEASYQAWRDTLRADPEYQKIYEEEAAKSELWLQLVEARQAAGLTQKQVAERMGVSQAQVARIEKRGYDAYTLRSLRRYIEALGDEFKLEVAVKKDNELIEFHSSAIA